MVTLLFNLLQMKKLLCTILFIASLSNLTFAQHIQFEWQNCFNGPLYDAAYDIEPTGDGYLIVGYYEFWDNIMPYYQHDVWLIKVDLDGNLLWDKKLGGSGSEAAMSIATSTDGNYYIVGGSDSDDGDISDDPYYNSLDYWIIKIDGQGNILWERIVGGNNDENIVSGTATSDGGVVAIGYTTSSDGDVSEYYGLYDMWIIKLNGDGQKEWEYTIGTSDIDFGITITETSDGGFLVGGASNVIGEGGNLDCAYYNEFADAVIFKLDANGNPEWHRCYGGTSNDGTYAIVETEDGYLLGCYGNSADGDLTGSGYHTGWNHLGHPTSDVWLIKTDFEGNIIWHKCYGGSGNDGPHKIFRSEDGGYMVFGFTHSYDGDVSGNHSVSDNYSDIWMFKINSSGDLLWQRCIGGAGSEYTFGVKQLTDVTYAIACENVPSATGDVGCVEDPTFNVGIWAFVITDTTTVGIGQNAAITNNISLYPNPAETWLIVEIPDTFKMNNALLQVLDANGRTLIEQKPVSNTTYLDIQRLQAGIYVLKLMNNDAFVKKRFVIR